MSDQDAFERILASLYDAMLDDAEWPATSALIDEACGTVGNQGGGRPDRARDCHGDGAHGSHHPLPPASALPEAGGRPAGRPGPAGAVARRVGVTTAMSGLISRRRSSKRETGHRVSEVSWSALFTMRHDHPHSAPRRHHMHVRIHQEDIRYVCDPLYLYPDAASPIFCSSHLRCSASCLRVVSPTVPLGNAPP